jgi:choline dehydrogenase-like flavoprotein
MNFSAGRPPAHADVLITGAGPAGGVAARRLAAEGLSVVALEQGHWQDREAYHGSQWDWELAAGKSWASNPNIRGRATDYPVDCGESDSQVLNFNGVGGSSIVYNAVWIRLLESNFRARTLHGFGDDWPISYADLQPFYERTDREMGASGLGGNPAYPPGADPPLPPLPFSEAAMNVARALHRRGWHWWPDVNAIASTPYDGRRACVQRGTCPTGCNEGAKASADVTHWGKAVALGASLVTGARVLRIAVDAQGLANGAEWVDEDGVLHFQSADVVLCAANSIGTPRLLLNSACPAFPDGLANRSDLVGRNLMLHPLATVVGLFRDEVGQTHYGSTVQCLEFGESDASRGFLPGAKWSLHPTGGGPLAAAMQTFAEGVPAAGRHQRFGELFRHGLLWSIMCEDLPDEANRVILSPDMTDSSGMPAPKLVYRYGPHIKPCLDFNVARASEVFRDAGAWQVIANGPTASNAHSMGTARMGDDPARSVVDRWGMSHDVPNLGIIDASVFVTSGPLNPTSTICALALRTAEHLIDLRANLPRPAHRSAVPVAPPPGSAKTAPPTAPEPLSESERARFGALAESLIPEGEGMPSAADAGVEGASLDRVLAARPDLLAGLKVALANPFDDPSAHLDGLAAEQPAAHGALLTAVGAAYYLDPAIQARIGYEGQVGKVQKPDRYPAYVAEGLLDHMLSDA